MAKRKSVAKTPVKAIAEPILPSVTPKKKFSKKAILLLLVVVGVLFYFKGLLIAAVVNGRPIFRYSIIRQLEKQSGQQILDQVITENLVLQEAQNKKITISQSEIDAEIKKIEDSLKEKGQTLEQVLTLQGISKDEVTKQIKLQNLVEKLLSDKINVSDEEINQYIKDNEKTLSQDLSPEQIKAQVTDQLRQQKLSQNISTWLEELKKKAKINYFAKY